MTRTHIPQEVLDAAHARSAARAARDWPEADRLRAEIEAAGWTIADRGTDFALAPATTPDVVEGERILYGSSASVPPRWDEPAVGPATVVLIAREHPGILERTLAAVRATSPAGTSVVVVADGPSDEQGSALEALVADDDLEVLWTLERLGDAAAANIGIRRARGPVVILVDDGVELTGDVVTPLVAALDDATVAIAGGWGTRSADVRRFEPAPTGDVDALADGLSAFRRADAKARGPLEERFSSAAHLATWWSLAMRDEGEEATPRRAVALPDLPAVRPPTDMGAEPGRADRRDRYRIIDRFGWRRDLLIGG